MAAPPAASLIGHTTPSHQRFSLPDPTMTSAILREQVSVSLSSLTLQSHNVHVHNFLYVGKNLELPSQSVSI